MESGSSSTIFFLNNGKIGWMVGMEGRKNKRPHICWHAVNFEVGIINYQGNLYMVAVRVKNNATPVWCVRLWDWKIHNLQLVERYWARRRIRKSWKYMTWERWREICGLFKFFGIHNDVGCVEKKEYGVIACGELRECEIAMKNRELEGDVVGWGKRWDTEIWRHLIWREALSLTLFENKSPVYLGYGGECAGNKSTNKRWHVEDCEFGAQELWF